MSEEACVIELDVDSGSPVLYLTYELSVLKHLGHDDHAPIFRANTMNADEPEPLCSTFGTTLNSLNKYYASIVVCLHFRHASSKLRFTLML